MEWDAEVVAIGDKIANLKIFECAQLALYLTEVHGLEPLNEVMPVVEVEAIEVKAEKTEFDVVLISFDQAKKLGLIKIVREILSLGLKESKDFVEATPSVVRQAVSKDVAASLKVKLEEFGGSVELR